MVAVPRAATGLTAEEFWQQRQESVGYQQQLADQRARRALAAYGALQQIQQRDYVSTLLGVDEYV